MKTNDPINEFENLPVQAGEFIKLIIKKMKYRKKVRQEVMAELAGHFEDELRDCKTAEEKNTKTRQLIEEFGDPQLLGVLLRRAKKRCRSWWRTAIARTFQAAGVLILLFIVYLAWFLNGKPEITVDYVGQLNKMVRPAVDESLNAAPLYHRAVEISENISEKDKKLLYKKYSEVTAEEKQKIIKMLADNNEMLEFIKQGTQKPYYWEVYKCNSNAMIALLLPNLSDYRKMAYALRWQAMLESEHRQYEKAFYDLLISYKFGQHVRSCPTVIEQLVGIAMENLSTEGIRQILSSYQIDCSFLSNLQNDMEQLITKQNFIVYFSGEKLFMYDEIQRSFTGSNCLGNGHIIPKHIIDMGWANENATNPSNPSLKKSGPERFIEDIVKGRLLDDGLFAKNMLLHPDKNETKKIIDEFSEFINETAKKTPAMIKAQGIDFENKIKEKRTFFLKFLSPAFGKVIEISYRGKTETYATLTVIAILRYKADKGTYPESLQELVASDYLNQVPMDPFSDKLLVYKKTDNDFMLYSVGLNFKDDGGKMKKNKYWNDDGDAVFWPVQQSTNN